MKRSKAIVSLMLCGALIGGSAHTANAVRIGEVIGEAVKTDIAAYINNYPIASYNIGGYTSVIAEDLAYYGFDVVWNGKERTLEITDAPNAERITPPKPVMRCDPSLVGVKAQDVLATDIKTYINGTEVEGHNINGRTVIGFELLSIYGNVMYDNSRRALFLEIETLPMRDFSFLPTEGEHILPKSDISFSVGMSPRITDVYDYSKIKSRWSITPESYIFEYGSDIFAATHLNGALTVDVYDSVTFDKRYTRVIADELPIFGAFYAGKEYNYIAYGRENPDEDDELEVIRIVKYDKEFNRVDSVGVSGCYTSEPFRHTSASFAESEGGETLVLHASRQRYLTSDGLRHQSQLTVYIDTKKMEVKNYLGEFQPNHVSHSFAQLALFDGENAVLIDHGDGYPRSVCLTKQNGNDPDSQVRTLELFYIPGDVGANCTGVSIGGFALSEENYILGINTVDHSKVEKYTSYELVGLDIENRDAVVLVSRRDNTDAEAVDKIYLTDLSETDRTAGAPYIVPLGNDRFMAIWQEVRISDKNEEGIEFKSLGASVSYDPSKMKKDTFYDFAFGTDGDVRLISSKPCGVKYCIMDGSGNILNETVELPDAFLSDCAPVYAEGRVIWQAVFNPENVSESCSERTFFAIPVVLPAEEDEE